MSGVWGRLMRTLRERFTGRHQASLPPPPVPEEPSQSHGLDKVASWREVEHIIKQDRETRQALQLLARMQATAGTRRELRGHSDYPGPYP